MNKERVRQINKALKNEIRGLNKCLLGEVGCNSYGDDRIDKKSYNFYNMFRTKEEAEFEAERWKVMRELEMLADDDEDCISRKAVDKIINKWLSHPDYELKDSIYDMTKKIHKLPSVTPQPKTGHWILTQRDKHIDINCSKCGNTRIKGYAYGYTVDELNLEEINDWIAKTQMNYCECCGAKMQGVKE